MVTISHTVRAHVGGSKNLGTLGPIPRNGVTADLLEICCFPSHLCYRATFGNCRSHYSSVIMEICRKILTFHATPTFQSFKVIGT